MDMNKPYSCNHAVDKLRQLRQRNIPPKQHFKVHMHNGTTVYETTDNRVEWAKRNAQYIDKLNIGHGAPQAHAVRPKSALNPHILLVMKWLNNPRLVRMEELLGSRVSARQTFAQIHTFREDAYPAAAAIDALDAAVRARRVVAAKCVTNYIESTGEDRQAYISKLGLDLKTITR